MTPNTLALHYTGVLEVPAAAISLRAIDPERYAIVNEEDQEVIEEIEESKAFYEVYDGAVYMFQVSCAQHLLSTYRICTHQSASKAALIVDASGRLDLLTVTRQPHLQARCIQQG